jgi:hypothetical protein
LQITHKFSKEVEKLQKQKLLNFSNPTTFSIKTFSNSAYILKFEFEIKRGQFLEIGKFKITLNFSLKLKKLKTPKLYILA